MDLIGPLKALFAPTTIAAMTDQELELLAGEPSSTIAMRRALTEKQSRLGDALRECLRNAEPSDEGR